MNRPQEIIFKMAAQWLAASERDRLMCSLPAQAMYMDAVKQCRAWAAYHIGGQIGKTPSAHRNSFCPSKHLLPLKVIMEAVADYYGIGAAEMTGGSRRACAVRAKRVFCMLAYGPGTESGASLKEIASALGIKDHTSIRHLIITGINDPDVFDEANQVVIRCGLPVWMIDNLDRLLVHYQQAA